MFRQFLAGLAALAGPLFFLDAQAPVPAPPAPTVTITLGSRHGHATPLRRGFTHTGGGNTDVAQPAPDTVVVTMTGVAVAGAHPLKDSAAALDFDLEQCFEVRWDDPKLKWAKLTLEARVVGLLRSQALGTAEQGPACATVFVEGHDLLTVCAPPHSVCGGENLSLNCREGPGSVLVKAGPFTLHQTFSVRATCPHSLRPCKASSAEFAPDPALDPLWISYWEPFHGANKKDFGFQVTLKAVPESNGN